MEALALALAEMLESSEVAQRIGAAEEIRRLTRASPEHRRALSCAVGPLVRLLSSSSSSSSLHRGEPHEQEQEQEQEQEASAAMLALLNLAVKDPKNKIGIVEAGSLRPITHHLQSPNPTLREHAAALLLTLSASSHNKPPISATNPAPLLLQVLKDGTKQAKADSLMSLYNLSTQPQNLLSLNSLHPHPVPLLLALISSCRRKFSKIAEKSCALLESLVAFDRARIALVQEPGGVLTVVELLEEGSLLGKEHAVGTLLTLCESNRDKYREVILSEGVIPGLLELTVHGTPKSRTKAHKLLDLLRDSTYSRPRLEADTIENIVTDVVSQMDSQDCADKARRMVADMVRVSMERSLRHLKQRAFHV